MISVVGNFSANSGQRLKESGKTKVKKKVPRKTMGLLPENGGRNRRFHWKTSEISLKRQPWHREFSTIDGAFLNDGGVFHVFDVITSHSIFYIHGFHDGLREFGHGH